MNYTNSTDFTTLTNAALYLMYDADLSEDHYSGEHSLYRLAAEIRFNTRLYPKEASDELKYVLNKLSNLPVRPDHLFVNGGDRWEVVWYAKEHQVVTSKKQYIQLILEFVSFLEEHPSPLFMMVMQEGFFWDDPNDCISGLPNEALNFSPQFNANCFGHEGEIEVIEF